MVHNRLPVGNVLCLAPPWVTSLACLVVVCLLWVCLYGLAVLGPYPLFQADCFDNSINLFERHTVYGFSRCPWSHSAVISIQRRMSRLKGLQEVRRVVVYHNDISHLQEAPDGHVALCVSPARCVHNNTASIQLYCCGSAGHDRTCNDVGHLPLGGSRRQLPDRPALFLPGPPVGHAVLDVFSSACLPF